MKKALLFSAMAVAAMTASAASAADYLKVTRDGTPVEAGSTVYVNKFNPETTELGNAFGYDDESVVIENITDVSYSLYWRSEYKDPAFDVVKSDPIKYGEFAFCLGVCDFANMKPDGIIEHVFQDFGPGEAKAQKLQFHLNWPKWNMGEEIKYTDAQIEAAKKIGEFLVITLCPQDENGENIEGAEFSFVLHFGPEGAAVDGIEAEENVPVEYYNLQGVKVANPEKGLYIVRQGNEVKKVIL